MHLDFGQFGEDLRHVLDFWPVELQIVARREMAVATVILAGDGSQCAQLGRIHHCVWHGNAEHRRVALNVEAILQTQRTELVVGQFA